MKTIGDHITESGGKVIIAEDAQATRMMVMHHYACEMAEMSDVEFVDRDTVHILEDVFKAMKSELKFREIISFMLGAEDVLSQISAIEHIADLRNCAIRMDKLSAENYRLHRQLIGFEAEEDASA